MTREVAHQKSFEKALYAIPANFPPGKLPGHPDFADKYYNMSQGEGDARGSWNEGEQWEVVDEREAQAAVDGGAGDASVKLSPADKKTVEAFASRTQSDPSANPILQPIRSLEPISALVLAPGAPRLWRRRPDGRCQLPGGLKDPEAV